MAGWCEDILHGVDKVDFPGAVPGVIVVFGENFHPIIANKSGQVLCAAGEVCKGRVVVFSHDQFVTRCKSTASDDQFYKNIKKWLTKSSRNDDKVVNVAKIQDLSAIPSDVQICSWINKNLSDDEIDNVVDWLKTGGSLVCGACPWGYLQLNPSKQVTDMPLSRLFAKIEGLVYAGGIYFKNKGHVVDMSENMASCARLDVICQEAVKNIELLEAIGDMIGYLPDDACKRLEENIKGLLENLGRENKYVPTKGDPISTDLSKRLAKLACDKMVHDGVCGIPVVAPAIDHFPGTFSDTPHTERVQLTFTSSFRKFHSTGCYLPAGTVMTVIWDGANKPWNITVGLHTDELQTNKSTWRRWPKSMMKTAMRSSPIKLCSPFGGLVYLESPVHGDDSINVTLTDITPAPVFTYDTADEWTTTQIQKPGLWCDIIGDKISFIFPSHCVRKLTDLTETMKIWDSVVDAHIDLRGCDPSHGRGQIVIADEQLQWGYMHAGYPICTHLDVCNCDKVDSFLLNGEKVKSDGKWGLFHELGHNFQDNLWTWDGTREVTVNIFTLHAMQVICNKPPWIHQWLKEQLKSVESYLKDGADIDKWRKNPGIALFVYAQLARDFGWDAYKTVFVKYNQLPSRKHPKTRQEKENRWIKSFSKTVKRNLCPLFEFWGWSIAEEISSKLKKFPPHLPSDETTTEMAPDRAEFISKKYGCSFSRFNKNDEL